MTPDGNLNSHTHKSAGKGNYVSNYKRQYNYIYLLLSSLSQFKKQLYKII